MPTIKSLLDSLPQTGVVEWIGLRPARREEIVVVDRVEATVNAGLVGDRYSGRSRERQVTLLQAEHLPVIAGILKSENLSPGILRRNILVSGINLLSLKSRTVRLGEAELEITGLCHPCSRMEELLGPGGYNAMRGHGGVTASIHKSGLIRVGDSVRVEPVQLYEAIACGLYDMIEVACMRQYTVMLELIGDEVVKGRAISTKTEKNRGEFLVLEVNDVNRDIRIDRIVSMEPVNDDAQFGRIVFKTE